MTDRLIENVDQAHLVALRENEERQLVDCGHYAQPNFFLVPDWEKYADTPGKGVTGTPGYGTDPETGKKSCFDCCHKADVELMRTADRFTAYLSDDHKRITNWPGGKLGTVTEYTESRGRWSQHGIVHRCYVRVTDVHGNKWYGTGPVENGTYVSLRRVKSKG